MLTLMPILAPLRTCWLLFQLVLTRALRVWESRVLAALSLFTPRPALAQGVPSDVSCSVHGAATAWPPTSYMPQDFEDYVSKNYDVSRPGSVILPSNNRRRLTQPPSIAKLLEQNRRTGIDQRAVFAPFSQPRWQDRSNPPTIADTDKLFRTEGVALAVRASRAALAEWAGRTSDITHVVMVTCTAAGSPGFDLAVCQALDLPLTVDRTLLHGVGCAGGMSIVRSASKIADAATLRGEKANILVCACELASTTVHLELERAEREADVSPGAVIFADGAAAMVLCNGAASAAAESEPLYGLMACTAQLIPDSSDLMSFLPGPGGTYMLLSGRRRRTSLTRCRRVQLALDARGPDFRGAGSSACVSAPRAVSTRACSGVAGGVRLGAASGRKGGHCWG